VNATVNIRFEVLAAIFRMIFLPWRWRQQVSSKSLYLLTRLHGVTPEKTVTLRSEYSSLTGGGGGLLTSKEGFCCMDYSFCVSEIEAAEACKWLRAAGFPQYAQMYEGECRSKVMSCQILSNCCPFQ
jgi:hypothetical protein